MDTQLPTTDTVIEFLAVNALITNGVERRAQLQGRWYRILPMRMMLADSVMNGSQGPLFYPKEHVGKNPGAWNSIPLVLRHPTESTSDGSTRHISARSPGVLERQGLGWVFGDKVNNDGHRDAEAWFDEEYTRQKAPKVWASILAGQKVELSTGLATRNLPMIGSHNGVNYHAIATDYSPDHLAVLPDERGACSLQDGCGIGVNQEAAAATCSCNGSSCKKCKKKTQGRYPLMITENYGHWLDSKGVCVNCGLSAASIPTDNAFGNLGKLAGKVGGALGSFFSRCKRVGGKCVAGGGAGATKTVPGVGGKRESAFTQRAKAQQASETAGQIARRASRVSEGSSSKAAGSAPKASTKGGKSMETEHSGASHHATDAKQRGRYTQYKVTEGGKTRRETHYHDTGHVKVHNSLTLTLNSQETNMDRDEMIAQLTTNCECWKSEGAKTALNSLPDDDLAKVHADAVEASQYAVAVNELKDAFRLPADMAVENMTASMKRVFRKKGKAMPMEEAKETCNTTGATVTTNTTNTTPVQQPKSLTEYLEAYGTDEERSVWNRLVKNEERQTQGLVNRIKGVIANTKNPNRKAALQHFLNGKPDNEAMEQTLALIEEEPATHNSRNGNGAVKVPLYYGAQGAAPVGKMVSNEVTEVLDIEAEREKWTANEAKRKAQ